jgi:alpha-tubulin suppressor-like RCC1 family protein/phosphodiesterase/alkaline phosphatase D-like protein
MLKRHGIEGGSAARFLLTMLVMGSIVLCGVTASPVTSLRPTQTVLGGSATSTALMAAGYDHSLLVSSDGTLWAWGNNDYGQLGLGDNVYRNSPTQVGSATNWVAVTAAWYHSLGLRSDGTLWAWGNNDDAQLGLGDTTKRNSPIQVGTATNWMAVYTGKQHSLGLRSDGTLWAWGNGDSGQLGLSNASKKSPTRVGSATNWAAIAAGDTHSLGVRSNGTLWAWGANGNGQLGFGDDFWRFEPVRVGSATNWVTVAAASNYSLGLRSDGTLWAWGKGDTGQLGLGDKSTDVHKSPTRVGSATNWVRVRPGPVHCLGVRSDGTLWAWGSNYEGYLGVGDTAERLSPAQVGSATNWVTGAAGDAFSLGVRSDGTIWGWGSNYDGELGLGDTAKRLSPTHVNLTGALPPSMNASATVISATAATLNGNLTSLGTALSVEVSFEWGLTTEYGYGTPAQTMAATGAFSDNLTGLSANTTYHFRAKAVGDGDAVYGDDMIFTTGTTPPAVTTSAATTVGTTSATLHGSLTNRGTASSVQVCFEWGPTTSYGKTTTPQALTGTSVFSYALNGLAAGTTYHYRAKAVGAGEAYGDDFTFATGTTPPAVTTSAVADPAATSAILNGNLAALGTAAGVWVSFEWGTTASYGSETTAQSISAMGPFSANLTGLSDNTTYHFRAKALGDGSAVYGDDMTFATASLGDTAAPMILTVNLTDIGVSEATITWATDEPATSQVQYGPTKEYGLTKTVVSNPVNSHSVDLTDLKAGKTYHYRVISKDAAKNVAVSEDMTLTTAGSSSGGMPTWAWVLIGLAAVGVAGSAAYFTSTRLAKK